MNKILHICESLRLGGEEKFLLDMYSDLDRDFIHLIVPLVHCGELYGTLGIENVEKYKNSRLVIKLYNVRNLFAVFIKPFLFVYFFWRIIKILRKEQPSGVVVYEPKINILIYLGLKIFKLEKNFKWYFRIGSQIFDENLPFLPKKVSQLIIIKIFKNIFHLVDCIVVVSHFLANELNKYYGYNEEKVFLLPICLPPGELHNDPHDHCFRDGKLYFVYAGRLETVKGVDILIEAYSKFVQSNNRMSYTLVIFGEGSKRKKIEKLVQQLNLVQYVKIIGYVNNPIIESDKIVAYILPSRSEGFGKVIIEAMNKYNLVISSKCTGPIEIIKDNHNGFLFENGSCESLSRKMEQAASLTSFDKKTLVDQAYLKSLQYKSDHIAQRFNRKLKKDFGFEESIFND